MNSEEISSEVDPNSNSEEDTATSDLIYSQQETLKYDWQAVEKIRKSIFTPLSPEATSGEKEESYSALTNDNNTIPLMNMGELYLKSQDYSK